jgi:hypothetical protein
VLHLHHLVLVLVFKQNLCLRLARWLGRLTSLFFLSFSGNCLVSSSLSEVWFVLMFQRSSLWFTSHSAFASLLSSGARSEICRQAPCCQRVMLVCWLFFSFAMSFDFGCCSVAQEWALWAAICPISGSGLSPAYCQPFCLCSLCLLKVHMEMSSLHLTPSPVQLEHPAASASCSFSAPCLLFTFFVCGAEGQSVQWARLVYPRGGFGSTACCLFAHLLVCWMSPKQFWSWCLAACEPSCFLSVMWHGEALYGLRVQRVEALILLGAFFLPSVAPASQQNFWFMELMLSASAF